MRGRNNGVRDNFDALYIIKDLDGTPLLDTKPYVPGFEAPEELRNGWLEKTSKTVYSRKSDDRFK